jgi:hypothetical protein
MSGRPQRRLARALLALAACAVLGGPPARAAEDELPPERPTTPYRAKVRNRYAVVEPGGGRSGGDTLEIRVSGARLFEDSLLLDEKTVIVDTARREVVEFDPRARERVAARFALNDAPIPYVHGRAAIAAIDPAWGPPRVEGREEVAGRACTVLAFGRTEVDGARACVSPHGVVLRLRLVWPGYEREFEVLDLDLGRQDEKWFRPPKGYRIVDGAG